jgi:hypothetical protein
MQKYRTSGRTSLMGLLLLVLTTIFGGAILGAVVALVAHFFYLVVLFPILMGLIGAFLITTVVQRGAVRSPLLAGLFGLLIGLVIYGTYRYGEYFDAQRQFFEGAREEYSQVTEAEAAQALDQFLLEETGSSGFLGYVLYDAKQGVTISKVGSSSSSSGITFSGAGAWIYWGVELLIIAGIAYAASRAAAAEPYCEDCHAWYGKERWIGVADKKLSKDIKTALKNGNFAQVRAAFVATDLPLPRLALTYRRCEHCTTANPVVILRQYTKSGRNNVATKQLMKGTVTPTEYMDMTGQALGTEPPAPPRS